MKRIISVALALVLICSAFLFAGCQKEEAGDQSLQKVLDKGTFVLGLDDSFPPMGYRDENNEIVGFDVDVAREVCNRIGVELKLQPISWTAKDQELNSGNIDCIWNGMSIDEERKVAFNLSEPYMNNRMVLVVLGDSTYHTLADLKGKEVAVQKGSTAEKILDNSEFIKTVKKTAAFNDNVTALMDMETKRVAAVFMDEVVANNFITARQKNYRVINESLADEQYAVGFRKADQKLRDEVQKTLSAMKKDGKLAEISTKWFGKDVTIVE